MDETLFLSPTYLLTLNDSDSPDGAGTGVGGVDQSEPSVGQGSLGADGDGGGVTAVDSLMRHSAAMAPDGFDMLQLETQQVSTQAVVRMLAWLLSACRRPLGE